MKLSLFVILSLVVIALGEGEKPEYKAFKELEEADVDDGDKLLEMLRSGTDEDLKKLYLIGIIDSSVKGSPGKEWTEGLKDGFKKLNFEDSEEKIAEGSDVPKWKGEDTKKDWVAIKDWEEGTILTTIVDIADKKDEDGKVEKSKFQDIKAQLVEPFYTGPPDRATPAIFVLKGTFAYLVTGPTAMDAVKDVLPSVNDGSASSGKKADS
jgi:hypothetical protein